MPHLRFAESELPAWIPDRAPTFEADAFLVQQESTRHLETSLLAGAARPCVLIVDDDAMNIDLMVDTLEGDYEVISASDGLAALQMALEHRPDAILLDALMPIMDGYEVCRRLKAQHATRDIPIIFATSLSNRMEETRALELGAVDFVTKPLHPASVRARIRNQVLLKQAHDRLLYYAETDALTGLSNRGHFNRMLAYEHARHARYSTEFSLVLLDIDNFKLFNDRHGHACGDECLRLVAGVIAGIARRETDLAARFGGEEFVLLLPETPLAGGVAVAEAMRRGIERLALAQTGSGETVQVTASFGVISVPGHAILSADRIVQLADAQLYEAKNSGRNRVCSSLAF
jgi:diguanylate cyclase (GGDEF)-like protein